MIGLIIGIACAALFCVLLYIEPRRFVNALVLLFAALFLFIGFAELTEHSEYINACLLCFVYILTPLAMLAIAGLLIINGFTMLRREGRRLSNLLSLLAGFAIIGGILSVWLLTVTATPNTLLMSVIWLCAILSVYFASTFCALLVYSLLYLKLPKKLDCDYIIVHGCGLLGGNRVSLLLKGRIDKAVEIYEKQGKTARFVLSGGQGADESISEAQAMKDYLLAKGYPEDAMLLEDRSTTTYENLSNVKAMLDGERKHKYIFVTNDYHVFRTGIFARKLGLDACGVGCRTAMYYWPSAFIREYVAVMVKYKWTSIAVILVWLASTIVSLLPFNF